MRGHIGVGGHCPLHHKFGRRFICEVASELRELRTDRAQEKREAAREIEETLTPNQWLVS